MRSFTVIWAGQLISIIGSGLTGFALGVWIYDQTGSATQFAINLLVLYLPTVLISPVAGAIVDRYNRRRVMLAADALAALSTIWLFWLFTSHQLQIWQIYAATFLTAAANTFHSLAYAASITVLVPERHLGRASGMTQAADAVAMLLAPALAGVLYATLGMTAIFAIDGATFLFAVGSLLLVRIPQPEKTLAASPYRGLRGLLHDAFFGWRYLNRERGILYLFLALAGCNFAWNLTVPMVGPMILDQASPESLGLVNSVMGVGMVVGTLILSVWGGPRRRIIAVAVGEMLCGVFIALTGLRAWLPLIAVCGFASWLTSPITNGNGRALLQSKVAPEFQGRVFAVGRMLAYSLTPLAYALSGPLADRVFRPLLEANGPLTGTLIERIMGVGPGRGIGLMIVLGGVAYSLIASLLLLHPRIRELSSDRANSRL